MFGLLGKDNKKNIINGNDDNKIEEHTPVEEPEEAA